MIKIGYICPNVGDATSLYRAVGPFQEIEDTHADIQFTHITEISWHSMGKYDIIFMQRPATGSDVTVCNRIKNMNIPLWLDYDDDLFSVPLDNPSYEMYSKTETQKNIVECLVLADIITVSTQTLLNKLSSFVTDISKFKLVENGFNDFLFTRTNTGNREKLIMWRGSITHVADLIESVSSIEKVAQQNTEYSWLFIGQKPWMFTGKIQKGGMMHAEPMEPITYMKFLNNIKPEIALVPLVNNEFNKAKSNIAWIEATFAGAICIAPSLPEFANVPCITYNTIEDLYDTVKNTIDKSPEEKLALVNESWKYIQEHLLLSTLNNKRVEMIKKLK